MTNKIEIVGAMLRQVQNYCYAYTPQASQDALKELRRVIYKAELLHLQPVIIDPLEGDDEL